MGRSAVRGSPKKLRRLPSITLPTSQSLRPERNCASMAASRRFDFGPHAAAQKTQRNRDDEAERIKTFRKCFGDQGVATIGPMEANLPELSKLAEDFVLDK